MTTRNVRTPASLADRRNNANGTHYRPTTGGDPYGMLAGRHRLARPAGGRSTTVTTTAVHAHGNQRSTAFTGGGEGARGDR